MDNAFVHRMLISVNTNYPNVSKTMQQQVDKSSRKTQLRENREYHNKQSRAIGRPVLYFLKEE